MNTPIQLETFALFSVGTGKPDSERELVLSRLANITKKPAEVLKKWLLRKPCLVSKGLSSKAAQKLAKALRGAGLDIVVQLQVEQACFDHCLNLVHPSTITAATSDPLNWLYVPIEKIFPRIFTPALELSLSNGDNESMFVFKSLQFNLSRYVAVGSGMVFALLIELYFLSMFSGSFSSTLVTILSLLLGATLLFSLPKLLTPMLDWQLFEPTNNAQLATCREQVCWHPLFRKFAVSGAEQRGDGVVYKNIFKPSELNWHSIHGHWRVIKGSDTLGMSQEVAVDLRDALVELPVISTLVTGLSGFWALAGQVKPASPAEDEPILELHDAKGAWAARLYTGSPSAIVWAVNNPQQYQSILVSLLALGAADV